MPAASAPGALSASEGCFFFDPVSQHLVIETQVAGDFTAVVHGYEHPTMPLKLQPSLMSPPKVQGRRSQPLLASAFTSEQQCISARYRQTSGRGRGRSMISPGREWLHRVETGPSQPG